MHFISRITANKKAVITIISFFAFVFITLCILSYNFYVKLNILTDPYYYPPEIETLFLTEINVSEFEVLSTEHIKNVIKDVSELKLNFINDRGQALTDYDSMPNSLKLLIDEFINGIVSRKDQIIKREDLLADLRFDVTEHYVVFYVGYSSISYAYTYYPNGVIRKTLQCGFTRKIDTINHYIDNNEIVVQKFYDSSNYSMVNDGELITKTPNSPLGKIPTLNSPDYQISVEDYNLFRSDYLKGLVPNDFILTIKNIHKYLYKR